MADERPQRSWSLTGSALNRLLETLDPEPQRAAAAYERLHARVCGLLRWWGSAHPEELADETLDRVARKLEEGAVVRDGSFGAYVRGVARMVFYESKRRESDQPALADDREPAALPPADESEALDCLDRCLAALAPDERALTLRYYEGGRKADVRRTLAAELGISLTALRIRTHRLRQRLERCVTSCLGKS